MTAEKAERCGMDHCPYPDCLVNGKCPSQMSLAASRIGATGYSADPSQPPSTSTSLSLAASRIGATGYSADSDSIVVKLSDGETSLDGGKTWFKPHSGAQAAAMIADPPPLVWSGLNTGYSADSLVVKLFTGPPTRKHVTDRQCSGKETPCMPGRDGKCTQCCDDQ